MYAVIQTGGKQYKVAENDIIVVEKLDGEAGDKVSFGDVLLSGSGSDVKVGAPLVKGASVSGEILEQRKAAKVLVFKKKRRQNYWLIKKQVVHPITVATVLAVVLVSRNLVAKRSFQETLLFVSAGLNIIPAQTLAWAKITHYSQKLKAVCLLKRNAMPAHLCLSCLWSTQPNRPNQTLGPSDTETR